MSYFPVQRIGEELGAERNLWYPPAVPNVLDDEFDGASLDPAWQLSSNSFGATPIDVYDAAFNSGQIRQNYNDMRRSYALFQIGDADNTIYYLTKDIGPIPDPFLVYGRFYVPALLPDANQGDHDQAIVLGSSSGGNFDTGNYMASFTHYSHVFSGSPPTRGQALRTQATVEGQVGNTDSGRGIPTVFEYAALHRVGSTIYCWAATADCNWQLVGFSGHTDLANFDRIGMYMITERPGTFSTDSQIFGVDFIRVITGESSFPL